MASRLDFHEYLKTIATNVYFQPPSDYSMKYPCITYSRKSIDNLEADDSTYITNKSYTVTVMDKNPDSPIVEKLLRTKFCKFDRQFVSGGLNHTALKIYY